MNHLDRWPWITPGAMVVTSQLKVAGGIWLCFVGIRVILCHSHSNTRIADPSPYISTFLTVKP